MAINPKAYSYKGRPNAEYQRFKEEYFSGQDVRIYLGNVWVDEIVDLRFQLVENVAPIFGYASYTYDAVAKGNRQVQGSFRINFKESYYLHSIINQLDYDMGNNKDHGTLKNTKIPKWSVGGNHVRNTIESIYNDKEFDKLATEFEKSLWGESSNSAMQERADTRGRGSYFTPEDVRKTIGKQGFSILIMYGPYTQTYDSTMKNESIATTAKTITGVHLTGVSQVVDGSGQPVYEEYTFIARDLDTNANLMNSRPKYQFGSLVDDYE